MFIKQFKVKNNVQFKATEKKKFRSKILAEFSSLSEELLNIIIPTKASVYLIKLITYNGTQVTVYSVDKRPMFFEIDNKLFPTVYTLWLACDIIPVFTTHSAVFPKLANGADLMIPGVVKQETTLASWGRFVKGEAVFINLTSNKAAIAVGTLANSSEDLYMSGGHGICVKVLHVFGDKLWSLDPTVTIQVPSQDAVFSVPKKDDFPSLEQSMKKLKIHEKKSEDDIAQQSTLIAETEAIYESELESEETKLSPNEKMDLCLKHAFLTAVIKLTKDKIQLPILASNFYRLHILPSSTSNIDIKLSSFKKVSKFLDKMSNDGLIVVKEETKGVEKITEIDFSHPEILSFKPDWKGLADKISNENAPEEVTPLFQSTVTELFVITEEVLPFFCYFKSLNVSNPLEKNDVLKYIKDYLGQHKIKPNVITRNLVLNEVLQKICETTEAKDVNELHSIILSRMELCYEMRNQTQPKLASGKQVPIQMTLATRSGNKKVTLINNLELYGIIVTEFAKVCKVGVAASTSITRTPGSKTDQLLVQGNQIKFVYDLLTQTYKIAPKNIQGLELAKKEKKKK